MANEFVFQTEMKRQSSTERDLFIFFQMNTLPGSDFYSLLVKKYCSEPSCSIYGCFPKPASTHIPSLQSFQHIWSTCAVAALLHHVLQHWQTTIWQRSNPCGTYPVVLSGLPPEVSPNFQMSPLGMGLTWTQSCNTAGLLLPQISGYLSCCSTPWFSVKLYFRRVLPNI